MLKALALVPQNIFRDRTFKEVIKVLKKVIEMGFKSIQVVSL